MRQSGEIHRINAVWGANAHHGDGDDVCVGVVLVLDGICLLFLP